MRLNMKAIFSFFVAILISAVSFSCASTKKDDFDPGTKKFMAFQKEDPATIPEVFRVVITSDKYIILQTKHNGVIEREADSGGDSYICDEISKLNKINEIREGLFSIWLFPDTGSLMKIRPQKPFFIKELDKLAIEDIQRWSFKFPQKSVSPTHFYIRFRVILKKKQTDEEIIKELQKKMQEKE